MVLIALGFRTGWTLGCIGAWGVSYMLYLVCSCTVWVWVIALGSFCSGWWFVLIRHCVYGTPRLYWSLRYVYGKWLRGLKGFNGGKVGANGFTVNGFACGIFVVIGWGAAVVYLVAGIIVGCYGFGGGICMGINSYGLVVMVGGNGLALMIRLVHWV